MRRSLPHFIANRDFRAPVVDAGCTVHWPLADDLGEQKADKQLDLVRRQRRGRIGHYQSARAQIRLFEPEATAIAVGEAVECRHAGARTAAFDGLYQALTDD